METWKIKILEDSLIDYQSWIEHVSSYPKFSGKVSEVIAEKIKRCLNRMKERYSNLDFTNLTDEEIVNLIISQEDYKDRADNEEIDSIDVCLR